MKNVLKLESLGLMILFTAIYFHLYPGSWGIFLALFFVPDISFVLYGISARTGMIAYNAAHHQGLLALILITGFLAGNEWMIRVGSVFLAHSALDRSLGYGLKYPDSFDHTHLGWIGKSKYRNKQDILQ